MRAGERHEGRVIARDEPGRQSPDSSRAAIFTEHVQGDRCRQGLKQLRRGTAFCSRMHGFTEHDEGVALTQGPAALLEKREVCRRGREDVERHGELRREKKFVGVDERGHGIPVQQPAARQQLFRQDAPHGK